MDLVTYTDRKGTKIMAQTSLHFNNFFRMRAIRLDEAMQASGERGVSVRYGEERYDCSVQPENCLAEKGLLV